MTLQGLQLRDSDPGSPYLAFGLTDILRVIGPDALAWTWQIGEADSRTSGAALAKRAPHDPRDSLGDYTAYVATDATKPIFRLIARFDMWFWEVWCADKILLDRFRTTFKHTETIAAPLKPIIVTRQARFAGSGWNTARSWFGGSPRLGDQTWPREAPARRPMHFVAQLDLADLAEQIGLTDLPASGSLAFFIGREKGAVLYVPRWTLLSKAPADLPPARSLGHHNTHNISPYDAPGLSPYWPVTLTRLNVKHTEWDCGKSVVERLFTLRQSGFSGEEVLQALGDGPLTVWWHGAIQFTSSLEEALRRALAELAGPQRRSGPSKEDVSDLEGFIKTIATWAYGNEPWQLMPLKDIEILQAAVTRATTNPYSKIIAHSTPRSLDDILVADLLALATAPDPTFAVMPVAVRDLINSKHLLPNTHWQQMFGQPLVIQGETEWHNRGYHLLLQLEHDDMMGWNLGFGQYQFWTSPSDLAANNWTGVRLTSEND